jgi:hypothetical protein
LGTPYSLAYASISAATQLKNTIADMINRAGKRVTANKMSVAFASAEKGAVINDATNKAQHDLDGTTANDANDASGINAW